ncbi:YgfZ/GcvT domain-containing protein [Pseudaestuariivita atlantica]|uniref:Aminomethyltransferase n=1 Tax=Pseudaestuariivita atlantica TaxID=1317121 RepID=A0A0L1JLV2_9RHOB|nr:folate-binding protein YgfZ [Pseudaestuariivita atlantica]KNG92734.1 aminomethyltransferase [Pseudaestuariivita atlantica]
MPATPDPRTVLAVTGPDAVEFLQNLVTNDVTRARDGLVYAALLTPQGKYLADFFVLGTDDGLLLDCAATQAPALAQRLGMYKLRAAVEIAESGLTVSRGTGSAPEGALADPRDPSLGWRLYREGPATDDGSDWDALRVAACVPQTGIELTPDTYILEAGFERLHGVDFRKGCYVGQEVTARMKHKTELRKGLARVRVSGDAAAGDEITRDGKAVGMLHTRAGDEAIAYLRFDRAGEGMTAGEASVSVI